MRRLIYEATSAVLRLQFCSVCHMTMCCSFIGLACCCKQEVGGWLLVEDATEEEIVVPHYLLLLMSHHGLLPLI